MILSVACAHLWKCSFPFRLLFGHIWFYSTFWILCTLCFDAYPFNSSPRNTLVVVFQDQKPWNHSQSQRSDLTYFRSRRNHLQSRRIQLAPMGSSGPRLTRPQRSIKFELFVLNLDKGINNPNGVEKVYDSIPGSVLTEL